MVLLDTCALLWWTLQPESLSAAASRVCARIGREGGCVSSVSLWEIGVKWKRKALDLGGIDLREYSLRLDTVGGLEIVPVSGAIWVESVLLDWDNRDPADRVIVAMARLRAIPVVTMDSAIRAYYDQVIW